MEIAKVDSATSWTGLIFDLYSIETILAKTVSTAGGLVWFSENVETDGTLGLEELWRWLHKLAFETSGRTRTLRHLCLAVLINAHSTTITDFDYTASDDLYLIALIHIL